MNTVMGWIERWNDRVRQLTIWDMKLAQIWTAAWILVLVKLVPQIMQLSVWWFVGVIALLTPWVLHVFFLRKNKGMTDL